MDNLFGKRGASMSGRSNPGRNDYNDGSSRNYRGNEVSARGRQGGNGSFNGVSATGRRGGNSSFNGVSARGRRGGGVLLDRRGSNPSGRKALESSDDEDEDESEDVWENETSSSPRRYHKTNDFDKINSNRRQTQSKRPAEEELDMDNWFDKRGISMSGRPKRGRNNDNDGLSRTSRGNGVSARGGRGEGDLLNRRGSKSSGRQVLKISDDEDEDESEDEDEDKDDEFDAVTDVTSSSEDDDEFDSAKPVGHKQPMLSAVQKADPKTSSVKVTGDANYLSQSRFDQHNISPLTLKATKAVGYERMTIVQEATLPSILKGKDVLAKAKTGTGKTVAFLLPAIEVIVKSPPVLRDEKSPPILVLVICPTRELASQAAAEANVLLKFHANIGVQVVTGGTNLPKEQKRLQTNPCQILVATPGRLRDHIENTPGFSRRLMGVKVLVLDEADHLLDMGFRKDLDKIIAAVPKERQTLLFSATVPEEVHKVSQIALKRDHEFINTVEEGSEETHSKVCQSSIIASHERHFNIVYAVLKGHISQDPDYKVLIFCTTARVTSLVAELLAELKFNVREIHSRKSQGYRTRISNEFRISKGLILVTSDVSARGVDYPDVTLVVQMGIPSDRQQYIHRLGRTGRKGKEGQGILLLAPWEEYFLNSVKDLPITKDPVPLLDSETNLKVQRALSHIDLNDKESAYQAWLGYYNSVKQIGRDKSRLVELANEFSRSMGLDKPPAIAKSTLSKMGLKNVPGIRTK